MCSMNWWRVVLLTLLTVLMPVRGALGVTMPLAHDAHPSTVSGAEQPCPHHTVEAPAAHGEHLAAQPGTDSHALCDVCHLMAMQVAAPSAPTAHTEPVDAAPRRERFASVLLPPGHKPPIPV